MIYHESKATTESNLSPNSREIGRGFSIETINKLKTYKAMETNKTNNEERTEWCEEDEVGIGCLYIIIIFLALACIIGFIAGKALC